MKVLVTGGGGFLGNHLMKALESAGHQAEVLDRPRSVLDIAHLDIEIPEAVIHLAGILGTAELFADFDAAVDVNVRGTHRVLEYCRSRECRYVGITMPAVWANVYQATKRCAQILASAWHEAFGLPVSHVRAYNAYGVGQKFGPGHPQKIIPTFAVAAWRGEPIPIWGDGEQTVDLISAGQIASVLVQALEFGDDEVFDAGCGVELTVNRVAELVISVVRSAGGPSSVIEHQPMRLGERPGTRLVASGEGWEKLARPPVPDIEDLRQTILSYEAGCWTIPGYAASQRSTLNASAKSTPA